jgi:predicted ribosomally synthesized peptide with nif11-like leader
MVIPMAGEEPGVQGLVPSTLEVMPSQAAMAAISGFSQHLRSDPALANAVRTAESPAVIVELAAAAGFSFTLSELSAMAENLGAPHWPWASRSSRWRRWFFS